MGYSTDFVGELKFANELTGSQLAVLNSILGEDARDHPEWPKFDGLATYIDLELLPDFSGVKWNGAEKTYGLYEACNIVTCLMRDKWPDFQMTGSLSAQGEDFDDRWTLTIDDKGWAHRHEIVVKGERIECPHCKCKFVVEAQS